MKPLKGEFSPLARGRIEMRASIVAASAAFLLVLGPALAGQKALGARVSPRLTPRIPRAAAFTRSIPPLVMEMPSKDPQKIALPAELLKARPGSRRRDSFENAQQVLRGLSEYGAMLPEKFGEVLDAGRRDPGFVWFDLGGGSGRAMVEAYYQSYADIAGGIGDVARPEGLFQGAVISYEDSMRFARRLTGYELSQAFPSGEGLYIENFQKRVPAVRKLESFRYLTGRLFQDIPEPELGRADLITDAAGIFSYAPDKFQVLAKVWRLLKDHGTAFLFIPPERIIFMKEWERFGGVYFEDYMRRKENLVPGLSVLPTAGDMLAIALTKHPGTIPGLARIASRLAGGRVSANFPPDVEYYLK